MSDDRPMNEYEGALFDALMVLTRAITSGEIDRSSLAASFRETAKMQSDLGRKNGSAVMEFLARQAEGDRSYTVRPPFFVIDGGKDE